VSDLKRWAKRRRCMAIYTTFFVMSATALTHAFPDWKPPLPEPESRVVTTFLGTRTIQTREPRFESSTAPASAPKSKVVQGDYADYLEARLPENVAKAPHWASKGLTSVELDPLGVLVDGKPALQEALFSPPSQGCIIYEIRKELLHAVAATPDEYARKWAVKMSTPEFTHSQTGVRVSPDWTTEDASRIIKQLVRLTPTVANDASLYLLIEP